MNTNADTKSVYQIVTDRIIEQLEKGVVPWHQPWTKAGLPRNLVSGRAYKNINWLLLSMLGYERNLFLTFKQVGDLGAKVRKGEHAHPVVFWKRLEQKKDESTGEPIEKKKAMLRYYLVFNISQCENLPERFVPPLPNSDPNPILRCEEIIKFMPERPDIVHEKHKAFYHIIKDYINMPRIETFENSESYYETLFHELVHSTGHESRLKRQSLTKTDMESYSVEELTAEIGACYLMSEAGIFNSRVESSTAYIDSWLKALKGDKKFIFFASNQAQRATDYILDTMEPGIIPEATESSVLMGNIENGDLDDLPF